MQGPFPSLAIDLGMVVQGHSPETRPCLPAASRGLAVIVGQIKIPILDDAVDKDQVMGGIAGEYHGWGNRTLADPPMRDPGQQGVRYRQLQEEGNEINPGDCNQSFGGWGASARSCRIQCELQSDDSLALLRRPAGPCSRFSD